MAFECGDDGKSFDDDWLRQRHAYIDGWTGWSVLNVYMSEYLVLELN